MAAGGSNPAAALRSDRLAKHLDYNGLRYTRQDQISGASSEKAVCVGTITKAGKPQDCALCFSQSANVEEMRHEHRILQRIGKHPNFIQALDWITAWPTTDGSPSAECLVLELVQPLGYDLFEVYLQSLTTCSSIPISQIRHYMGQLVSGLRYMHGRGVIHRDVKAENVLIEGRHSAKLIDFGLAVCPSEKITRPMNLTQYIAPELTRGELGGEPPVDLWGCGVIIYFLGMGQQPYTQNILTLQARGTFQTTLGKQGIHEDGIEAAIGLLARKPEDRWDLDRLQAWVERDAAAAADVRVQDALLQRYMNRLDVPSAFGAQLPADFTPRELLELRFMARGLQVVLIIRNAHWKKFFTPKGVAVYKHLGTDEVTRRPPAPMECISVPGGKTQLQAGDWIYFGCAANSNMAEQATLVASTLSIKMDKDELLDMDMMVRDKRNRSITTFFPEFDSFQIPRHCVNAVLGPRTTPAGVYAQEGQNALDLRIKFNMNLAGVARADGSVHWWPGGGILLQHGDRGLLMRVPDPQQTGQFREPSRPSVSMDALQDLMDETRFMGCLGLNAEQWAAWLRNIPEEAGQDATVAA